MEPPRPPVQVVCVASHFKGGDFLAECKRQGARVGLVTRKRTEHEAWPREAIDELLVLPDDAGGELVVHAVGHLARSNKLQRVVALEEFDVVTAALAREHLRLPGPTSTEARQFRDKLAMRGAAQEAGLRVPEFVHALNYQEVGEYLGRVPPPWVLK